MADNTLLNPGSGGDTIRDLNRTGVVKTQVVQLDIGGAATNAEVLITAGSQTSANSLPVVLASDQPQYANLISLMQSVLLELKVMNQLLVIGLNIADDPDLIRSDPSNNPQ